MNKFETQKSFEGGDLEKEMKETARQNFSVWNEALLSKDAEEVAELYSEKATFLPTMSKEFKKGPDEAQRYFEHFLEKNPAGEIVEDEVQVIDQNHYLHSGMYNFTVGPEDKREIVEARFTFMWEKDEAGDWKVAHHHSSIKPV
jgi:uncharacterized protein (TIGR02246 family)